MFSVIGFKSFSFIFRKIFQRFLKAFLDHLEGHEGFGLTLALAPAAGVGIPLEFKFRLRFALRP